MSKERQQLFIGLPAVDHLLKQEAIQALGREFSWLSVKNAINEALAAVRQEILQEERVDLPTEKEWLVDIANRVRQPKCSLRRVINGTGTIIHTNLGRSSLSANVRQQLEDVGFHYSNLEFDLETGARGSRYSHLTALIKELTGAEDVLVVNNNAAAVLLALSTLTQQKKVLVSRGELVEIGGSFRIPEVITSSGGEIIEVGATNKTHLADYQRAVTEETGAILKVHTSNYRIIGFTESVPLDELATFAHQQQLPLINDLGSGLFIDMRRFGLPYEPTVREVLAQGCDVVTFSGDKLLGGPQAGIIVGKKAWIEPMKKNQLLRALRIDKLTLSALEATLALYLDEKQAIQEIPVLNMLAQSTEKCREKAEKLAEILEKLPSQWQIAIQEDQSNVGGGSYPEYSLPTFVVALHSPLRADELQARLRRCETPIVSRIKNDTNYLDLRTLTEEEFPLILQGLQQISFEN